MMLPWSTSFDVAYTGRAARDQPDRRAGLPDQHQHDRSRNGVRSGAAGSDARAERDSGGVFARGAESRIRCADTAGTAISSTGSTTAGGTSTRSSSPSIGGSSTACSSAFNDTIVLSDVLSVDPRYDHGPDGQRVLRADQAKRRRSSVTSARRATTCGPPPSGNSRRSCGPAAPGWRALRLIVNDWQLSGIWTGTSGSVLHREPAVPDRQREREPDWLAGLRAADPHRRGSGRWLQQRPLPAVQHRGVPGPAGRERGLESGNGYLFGCFQSVLDLAIARNIRLGGNRTLQLRVDMFNAFNWRARVTGRNTSFS